MNAWVFTSFVLFLLGHFWLFFRDRRMVLAKIVSSIALIGLIALLSQSYAGWLGWPADRPDGGVKYRLIAVDIRQPRPDSSGHIYVWLMTDAARNSLNPFVHTAEPNLPRAFEIPFTQESEKAMQRAAQAMRLGQDVSAVFGEEDGTEGDDTSEAESASGNRRGDSQRLTGDRGGSPRLLIDEPRSSASVKQ
jgi:hypothetical protein